MTNKENDLSNLFFQTVKSPQESNDSKSSSESDTNEPDTPIEELTDRVQADSSKNIKSDTDLLTSSQETLTDINSDTDNENTSSSSQVISLKDQDIDTNITPNENISENIDNIALIEETEESEKKEQKNSCTNTKMNSDLKRSLKGPIIGAALLLAIAVCYILHIVFNNSPSSETYQNKSYVSKYFETGNPIEQAFGTNDLINKLSNESSEVKGSLKLVTLYDNSDLTGLNLDFNLRKDMEQKIAACDMAATYRNASVISMNSYMNESNIMAKFPSISEGVFTAKVKDLKAQMKQSDFFKESDPITVLFLNDYLNTKRLENMFNTNNNTNSIFLIDSFINKIASTYPNDFDKLKKGISYQELGTDPNGNVGTRVTVDAKTVCLSIEKILSLPLDCEDFNEIFGRDDSCANYIDDQDIETYRDEIKQFINALSLTYNTDLVFDVYTNKNGLLTSVVSSNDIELGDEVIHIEFNINTTDYSHPSNDLKVNLEVEYDDETYSVSFINKNNSDNNLLSNVKIVNIMLPDGESKMLNYSESYNQNTGVYKINIYGKDGINTIFDLLFSGKVSSLDCGNTLTINFDNISFTYKSELICKFEGSLSIDSLETPIEKPTGTEYKIFEMTESELEPIENDITKNMLYIKSLFDTSLDEN